MSFQKCLLGDVLTLKRGYDLPEYARNTGEIPVISSSGITGTHNEAKVHGPGVVTGRYGTLGEVYYVENDFWPLNTARYVNNFHNNDPHFIYYFLRWILKNFQSDKAAIPGVNRNDLHAREVILPTTIQEQYHISSILSTYDDLIENNRRRMRLLEESARLLYKEWFVHLRFPGHEHCKIVDGVPEGWKNFKIKDVCTTVGGGTPSTSNPAFWDGDITWIVPTDITHNTSLVILDSARKITEKGLRESAARIVPPETILMTSRASVGYFGLIDYPVCTNQGFINIIPNNTVYRMYILFNLLHRVEEIRKNAKGTTYPEISKGCFRAMDICIPEQNIAQQFEIAIYPIIQQTRMLMKMNKNLAAARDLLLPRLMSGEVAV